MNLWQSHPDALLAAMADANLRRGWLVTDPVTGELRGSHPALDSITHAVRADARDYHGHQGCFFEVGEQSGHLLSAFVHKTVRGQAAGGVRFWGYGTMEAFVRDGLRLSRGMGHKCALAGLWWGGGKGVIARRTGVDHRDPAVRAAVYADYGRFISGLRGCYVTAEDAGTGPDDMAVIHAGTRHTTCIPPRLGGSGNPSALTARGVVVAMEAGLSWLGRGGLDGKTVATQGLGHVARYMIPLLVERGVARIVGVDVDDAAIDTARRLYPDAPLEARRVAPGDNAVLGADCDVLAPNAVGATLNPDTIPSIRAPLVCGGANNQLADPARDGPALAARGVLYVPDFLANRMGIVNCANEQYGCIPDDPAITSHLDPATPHGIFQRALEVFRLADASGRPPADEAERLAEALSDEPHPVWGNRGQTIIDALLGERWASAPRCSS